MAQSLAQIYIHFIFHVKWMEVRREHLEELWHYLAGIARGEGSYVVKIGGEPDHVHILCTLPRTIAMAEFAERLKGNSSKWLKGRDGRYLTFSWQRGYAAFSVSQSRVKMVTEYIENQVEHHKKETFQEEYLQWLKEYGIEYDPQYVFSN